MNESEVAFIMAAIQLGYNKNLSELRGKLNPDNKIEKVLVNYLDSLLYSSKADSTK